MVRYGTEVRAGYECFCTGFGYGCLFAFYLFLCLLAVFPLRSIYYNYSDDWLSGKEDESRSYYRLPMDLCLLQLPHLLKPILYFFTSCVTLPVVLVHHPYSCELACLRVPILTSY